MTEFVLTTPISEGEISSLTQLRLVTGLMKLAEVNEERLEEYSMALNEASDIQLQSVLQPYHNQCQEFIIVLSRIIKENGGEYTKPIAKTRKKNLWAGFMRMLSLPDKSEILKSCEYRESIAVASYKNIMALHQWPYELFLEIRMQKQQIEDAFNEMMTFSPVPTLSK